jgi:hypothetical protein
MSMTTRESMRRELKELAKLAETMGKQTAVERIPEADIPVEFAGHSLERPLTPSSASRVSVAPFTTPTLPPAFELDAAKGAPKRTGLIAVIVGASLAAALVGGAAVGMSRGGPTASTVAPSEVHAAAAAIAAPPPETTPVAAAPPAAVAPQPVAPVAVPVAKTASPIAAPVVHKHVAPKPGPAVPAAKLAASTPAAATDSDRIATPAAKPAPTPKAKPAAAAAAGGGTDSLEDLIRKEVAAHK